MATVKALATANENQSVSFANKLSIPSGQKLQSLTATDSSGDVVGTVSVSGSNIVFQPNQNYVGEAIINYTVIPTRGTGAPTTLSAGIVDVKPPAVGTPKLSASTPDSGALTAATATDVVDSVGNNGGQEFASVATFPDGSYVMVWTDTGHKDGDIDQDGHQVRAQLFNKDGSKLGADFQVNSTTDGDQVGPRVTAFANGTFAVTWQNEVSDVDGDELYDVRSQMFSVNKSGKTATKIGGEVQVGGASSLTGGFSPRPNLNIAALKTDPSNPNTQATYAITWQEHNDTADIGKGDLVKLQLMQANGTPFGGPITIAAPAMMLNAKGVATAIPAGNNGLPSVAGLADGGFIVTWDFYSFNPNRDNNDDVLTDPLGVGSRGDGGTLMAERFDAHGNPVPLKNADGSPVLLKDSKGNLLKDANGQPIAQTVFSPDTPGRIFANDVSNVTALANGGFAVTWEASQNTGADQDDSSIQLQIYDANGQKVGTQQQINTTSDEYQRAPVVKELSNGDLVIAWKDESEENGDTSGSSIKAQIVDPMGNRIGKEFVINTTLPGDQLDPTVDTLPNGGFIVNWTDTETGLIMSRSFNVSSVPQDTAARLNITASKTSTDPNETFSLVISNIPAGATLSDGVHSFTATDANRSVDLAAGGWSLANLSILPPAGYTGNFELTVTATEGYPGVVLTTGPIASKSVTQTIDIAVASTKGQIIDEALSGPDAVLANAAKGTIVATVQGIDTLPGVALTYSLTNDDNGAFAIDATTGVISLADGSKLTSFGLTPITVRATDRSGKTFDKAFNVNVVDPAHPFTAVNEHQTTQEGAPVTLSLSQLNADSAATLSADPVTISAIGPVTAAGGEGGVVPAAKLHSAAASSVGSVALDAEGNLVFTPAEGFAGVAQFSYTLSDASGNSSTATVTVDVAPVAAEPDLSASSAAQAANKQSPESVVNTTTRAGQLLPSVATFPDGSYVVAWYDTSGLGGDSSNGQIKVQAFNADGTKLGAETRVNTVTNGDQRAPEVAALSNGNFVVTWRDESADGGNIKSQLFGISGKGTANGSITKIAANGTNENLVNAGTTAGTQDDVAVTALANGCYVITWVDQDNTNGGTGNGGQGATIRAQMYQANGTPMGQQFQVNPATATDPTTGKSVTLPAGNSILPSVTGLKDGGFVVTWDFYPANPNDDGDDDSLTDPLNTGSRGDGGTLLAMRFNADGSPYILPGQTQPQGAFTPDTPGTGGNVGKIFANDVSNVTALADGGFAVVWEASQNTGADQDDSSVQLQIYNADGTKRGPEQQINTTSDEYQRAPVVTQLSNGNLAIAWKDESEENGDTSDSSIKAQIVDVNGNRIGGEFVVNSSTRGGQLNPSIGALPNGDFIVTWTDQGENPGDTSDDAIRSQIFSTRGAAMNSPVMLNIAAQLTDPSETLDLTVKNIPIGATLTDGFNSFTSSAENSSVDISTWSLGALTVTPPHDFSGDMKLDVVATGSRTATLSPNADGSPNVVTDQSSVTQTIDVFVDPTLAASGIVGSSANDLLAGRNGDTLVGNGGNDTYRFDVGGGQQRIANGTGAGQKPVGELDFGADVHADQLWFKQTGKDLTIEIMGTKDQITINNWFGGAKDSALAVVKTQADDTQFSGANIAQLVQAMASYSAHNAGFDPTRVSQLDDPSLQSVLAANSHSSAGA